MSLVALRGGSGSDAVLGTVQSVEDPVGRRYPWLHTTLRPQSLREDRILSEIHATGGDIRRICDLFGLSVEGATRYLKSVEHHDLTTPGMWVPRT